MDPENRDKEKKPPPIQMKKTPSLRWYTIPTATPHPLLASSLTLQSVLAWLALSFAFVPELASHRDRHPHQPNDSRHDPVPNFRLLRLIAEVQKSRPVSVELETQAAVDDAKCDERTTVPDMGRGPERAAIRALEDLVVDLAEDKLEREKADDQKADDGVGIVELRFGLATLSGYEGEKETNRSCGCRGDIDPQTQSHNRERVGQELRSRVHPYEPREREDPNQNRANGEDEGKRKAHDRSMRHHGFVPTLEILGTIARRSSGVAGLTGRGRGGGTPARSGTTRGGLRGKRVQGVSTFGHRQVEVDVAHVVVLRETCEILLVTFDGGTGFDGPDPLGFTGRQIHLTAPPIRATRAFLVYLRQRIAAILRSRKSADGANTYIEHSQSSCHRRSPIPPARTLAHPY